MKVALVYDRVNKWGGAERVLLALHALFPEAPLYTSVYNPDKATWAGVFSKIHTSFLQEFPFAKTSHEFYALLMPLAFESFTFDEYDIVISVTSEAAKGILTKPRTMHVCYCLTPTRYLWSGYEDYFASDWFRMIAKPVVSYLRLWDKIAAQRPDYYIAISGEVQKRIKTYYGRESEVVYPPVTVLDDRSSSVEDRTLKSEAGKSIYSQSSNFKNRPSTLYHPSSKSGYFLIVSRLVPYKRIDIAIEAFNILGLPLKIIGTGSEFGKLKSVAKDNIEFLGNLTDGELRGYYENCIALITPGIEDFGLSVLEAMSFGKSIISFGGGGAKETVIEGITGEFFYPQTKKALVKTLKNFDASKYDSSVIKKHVERFSEDRFKKEFVRVVNNL